MSENDIRLIEEARALPYMLWFHIDALIERAESPEAREKLRGIQIWKYHEEEYYVGNL